VIAVKVYTVNGRGFSADSQSYPVAVIILQQLDLEDLIETCGHTSELLTQFIPGGCIGLLFSFFIQWVIYTNTHVQLNHTEN